MSYNPESKENDPVLLFRVVQQYPNFCPEDIRTQRELVGTFHDFLNGNGRKRVSVSEAESYRLDEVARKIWKKAQTYLATITDDEHEVLKHRSEGKPLPRGHPLEQRIEDEPVYFDIPGCRD
jgi:hypothetical protein